MLQQTWWRLAVNKNHGHRWAPIPRPPPPGYDRLCGTHAVLHTLKAFASSVAHTATTTTTVKASHPHRSNLNCLYVRDFSIEAPGGAEEEEEKSVTTACGTPPKKKMKVIPKQYFNLHRIVAMAKLLEVPIRYVPRRDLMQLCGDRRNQNVVLEVGQFEEKKISSGIELEGIQSWLQQRQQQQQQQHPPLPLASSRSTTSTDQIHSAHHDHHDQSGNNDYTVLFLDHVVDPTNVGTIIRTGYFYGVDEVVLSHDTAHCTAAVARSSAGLLEHMRVYQCFPSVSTADFLRHTRADWAALQRAMAERDSCHRAAEEGGGGEVPIMQLQLIASTAAAPSDTTVTTTTQKKKADTPAVPTLRILLLGNEDKGLSAAAVQQCTHVAHIVSPRQQRLRASHRQPPAPQELKTEEEALSDKKNQTNNNNNNDAATTELARRAYQQRRLLQLSASEVSLNVNTACASLLPQLLGEETKLTLQPLPSTKEA